MYSVWCKCPLSQYSKNAFSALTPSLASGLSRISAEPIDENTCIRYFALVNKTFNLRWPPSVFIVGNLWNIFSLPSSGPYVNEIIITSRWSPWTVSKFFINSGSSLSLSFWNALFNIGLSFLSCSKQTSISSLCLIPIATIPSVSPLFFIKCSAAADAIAAASLRFLPAKQRPFFILLNFIPYFSFPWKGEGKIINLLL